MNKTWQECPYKNGDVCTLDSYIKSFSSQYGAEYGYDKCKKDNDCIDLMVYKMDNNMLNEGEIENLMPKFINNDNYNKIV